MKTALIALTGLLLLVSAAFADTPPAAKLSPRALVEAAFEQRRPSSMKLTLQMTLRDSKGGQWVRSATLITKQRENGRQLQVFSFVDPPALAGSAVLTREEPGSDAAQWLYVPAYHAVRRVPSANVGDAYLGTDYFFEDVLDKRWDDYAFRALGDEQLGGAMLTKVEVTPKTDALKRTSSYARTVYFIEPVRQVIVKEEYFDKQGKLLKVLRNSGLKPYGKYRLWDAAIVENVQTGHSTLSQVVSRQVDVEIDDELFTERALKRSK